MPKAYLFLKDGFEEIEALTPVDFLRRADAEVVMVSATEDLTVTGAHGIGVVCDRLLEDPAAFEDADMIILPGGQPGTDRLLGDERILALVRSYHAAEKYVAAICAAPMVLGKAGILEGKKATCYPGCEGGLRGAQYTRKEVETDGKIITAHGPGGAMAFASALIAGLCGQRVAKRVAEATLYML